MIIYKVNNIRIFLLIFIRIISNALDMGYVYICKSRNTIAKYTELSYQF